MISSEESSNREPLSPTTTSSCVFSIKTGSGGSSCLVEPENYIAGESNVEYLKQFQLNNSIEFNNQLLNLPPTIYYISNFITIEEEKELLRNIYGQSNQKWKQLNNRRLQMWGGQPNDKLMFEEPLPKWLQGSTLGLNKLHTFPNNRFINHVLINEYEINQGIMYHKDGPIYYPMVFILSLESEIILNFKLNNFDEAYQENCNYVKEFSVIAEPRSLLVFTDDIYHYYMHGIEETKGFEIHQDLLIANKDLLENKELATVGNYLERKKRVSLTCRCVRKSAKKKNFIKL
ncbi:hypothetical protein ABK040_015548 [Willaertia magna]